MALEVKEVLDTEAGYLTCAKEEGMARVLLKSPGKIANANGMDWHKAPFTLYFHITYDLCNIHFLYDLYKHYILKLELMAKYILVHQELERSFKTVQRCRHRRIG